MFESCRRNATHQTEHFGDGCIDAQNRLARTASEKPRHGPMRLCVQPPTGRADRESETLALYGSISTQYICSHSQDGECESRDWNARNRNSHL